MGIASFIKPIKLKIIYFGLTLAVLLSAWFLLQIFCIGCRYTTQDNAIVILATIPISYLFACILIFEREGNLKLKEKIKLVMILIFAVIVGFVIWMFFRNL